MGPRNREFELGGVNHIALVCRDMARTVAFYRDVMGMPLTKTLDIPGGGQHFFFDIGNGDSLAFFWFAHAPEAQPGVSAAAAMPGTGDIVSAHGSMNHLSFNVPLERFEEYHRTLAAKGVDVSRIVDHDDSPSTIAKELHPGVFIRSFYFQGPDGELLEFAAWTRALNEADVNVDPVDATGTRVPLVTDQAVTGQAVTDQALTGEAVTGARR
ncbi:MAG: VOC family protein [Acidimicrobiia bacterium]|nr:VOC family protein [Acidimicrobiia bacterium]